MWYIVITYVREFDVELEDVWDGGGDINVARNVSCRGVNPIAEQGRFYEPSSLWCWNLLTWSHTTRDRFLCHVNVWSIYLMGMLWAVSFWNRMVWALVIFHIIWMKAPVILNKLFSNVSSKLYVALLSTTPRYNRMTSLMSESDKGMRGSCRS